MSLVSHLVPTPSDRNSFGSLLRQTWCRDRLRTYGHGMALRFNHMELTLPLGTLTDEFRAGLDVFYGGIFGFGTQPTAILDQDCHFLRVDDKAEQFILVAEHKAPMSSPGYDHLGFLLDTRTEVDDLLAACKSFQATDDRVQIKEYDDLVSNGEHVTHAFYVKYLLPIWFDVQCQERNGKPIVGRWNYT